MTIREFYLQFMDNTVTCCCRANTIRNYQQAFKLHLLPWVGDIYLDCFRYKNLQSLVAKLLEKGLKKSTIKLTLSALKCMFSDAVRHGLVDKNPVHGYSHLLKNAPPSKGPRPFTSEELRKIECEAIGGSHDMWILFNVMRLAGLRLSEALSIKRDWVDWCGKILRVYNSKTESGLRSIPITHKLGGFLSPERFKYSRYLFVGLGESTVRSEWTKILKDAGIEHRGIGQLRHTFASRLLSKGAPVTFVSKVLGHSSPAITLSYYARWVADDRDEEGLMSLAEEL